MLMVTKCGCVITEGFEPALATFVPIDLTRLRRFQKAVHGYRKTHAVQDEAEMVDLEYRVVALLSPVFGIRNCVGLRHSSSIPGPLPFKPVEIGRAHV